MGRTLRVGIVGIGFGQQVHVPAFRKCPSCHVSAICATSLERAQRVAENLRIPTAYGDWREMLDSGGLDVVASAVPATLQPQIVQAAAERGIAVFCEKPAAATAADATAMLAAVNRAGVVHAIDFLFPEVAAWQRLKSLLDDKAVGRLRHAALSWRTEIYAVRHQQRSWKTRPAEGGGVLNTFVSHCIYNLEWLFGPIKTVNARLFPPDGEDELRLEAWLDFACGLPVSVAVATDAHLGSGHRLELYGDDGTLVLENQTRDHVNGFRLWHGSRTNEVLQEVLSPGGDPGDGRVAAAARIVERFASAILGGAAVTPNLADGLRVQQMLGELRRSASSKGADT
jgi:predicted dehydrogenase